MPLLPKRNRIRGEAYLKAARAGKCRVCGQTPCDAHHVQAKGAGGGDDQVIPLCRMHHAESHANGGRRFHERHPVSAGREANV